MKKDIPGTIAPKDNVKLPKSRVWNQFQLRKSGRTAIVGPVCSATTLCLAAGAAVHVGTEVLSIKQRLQVALHSQSAWTGGATPPKMCSSCRHSVK